MGIKEDIHRFNERFFNHCSFRGIRSYFYFRPDLKEGMLKIHYVRNKVVR